MSQPDPTFQPNSAPQPDPANRSYGRILGFEGAFLCEYLPILIEVMGDPYRELLDQRLTIERIIEVEEDRFQRTLQQGTELLEAETRDGVSEADDDDAHCSLQLRRRLRPIEDRKSVV